MMARYIAIFHQTALDSLATTRIVLFRDKLFFGPLSYSTQQITTRKEFRSNGFLHRPALIKFSPLLMSTYRPSRLVANKKENVSSRRRVTRTMDPPSRRRRMEKTGHASSIDLEVACQLVGRFVSQGCTMNRFSNNSIQYLSDNPFIC